MNAILEVLTKDNIAFFADKIIPILTLLGAVFAAIAAIYKYFNEKNREFYMSVLNDVYEPLYEEIVVALHPVGEADVYQVLYLLSDQPQAVHVSCSL